MDWQVAHGCVVDPDGGIRSASLWDHSDAYPWPGGDLDLATPLLPALSQRATTTQEPAWTTELTGELPEGWALAAKRAGLVSGAAIPIITDDGVGAVLEFLDDHPIHLDDDFVSLFHEVGRQLGSVVERERHLAELDAISDELRRSNLELERFAYIASHDLQEPLRKIVGFSQLLTRRHADALDDEAAEYLDYVVDGAKRLQDLIQDLLHYSRAGRDDLDLEPLELTDLVDDVLADLSMAVDDAAATIDVGDLPQVAGDRSKLTALLNNLVANALKFRGDGPPHISISGHRAEDGWEIAVEDDGIGIDPAQHERVFEVFSRLHTREAYPGTGIGLAVCRRIVERHGGRLWVEPGHDGGSVFRFTLPTVDAATSAHEPEETTR